MGDEEHVHDEEEEDHPCLCDPDFKVANPTLDHEIDFELLFAGVTSDKIEEVAEEYRQLGAINA